MWTSICELLSLNTFHPSYPYTMYVHVHVQYSVLASYQVSPCVNNVWTLQCEHPYVNYLSLNTFHPSCPCTINVYVHVHVVQLLLHHTKCHHVLTMCEHYSVNIHMWITCFKYIPPFMSMYNVYPCTMYVHVAQCYLHHTKCHHVLTICEHYSVNIHMWITCLINTFHPSCPYTMYVHVHVHILQS